MNKLFEKLSPDDVKALKELTQSGAITIDEAALPAHLRYETGEKTVLNVFRAMIKGGLEGEIPDDLASMTERDLKNMVNQLNAPQQRALPDNYVSAPKIFGHAPLNKDDLEEWRNFRRDMRDCAEMEAALTYITNYHEKHGFKFAEQALIDQMHIVLPVHSLKILNSLRGQGANLAHIFQELSHNYGSKASSEQTIQALNSVADTNGSALDKLEALKTIVLKSNYSQTIQTLALHEARRVIRTTCGNQVLKMIDMMINNEPSFNEFCRMAKTHFLQELEMKPKSRLHHVNTYHEEAAETNALLSQVVKLLSDSHIRNQQTPMVNHVVDQPRCYSCQAYGHFSRDCYKNRSRRNNEFHDRRNNLPYADRICYVHKRGHTNKECYVQQIQCTSHKGHTAPHMQGECRRRNDLSPFPQHNGTNYSDRDRAERDSVTTATCQLPQTHPPLKQTNHIRNAAATAQDSDMVRNLTDILNQAIVSLNNGQA